jgi:hypothetical protein
VFTIDRIECSGSTGLDVHDQTESVFTIHRNTHAAGLFGAGSCGKSSEPEVDLKTLHAKIGELTLENDFLSAALGKAGHPSAKR